MTGNRGSSAPSIVIGQKAHARHDMMVTNPDLAALLFSWADEIEGVLQRNEQLRLNFQANNSSSPESEQDENDSSDGHDGHPKSEDVP